MSDKLRRAGNCCALSILACWLWLSSLLPAAAAQPTIDVTTLHYAIDDTFLSLPAAERTSLLRAVSATESKNFYDAPRLAQNKPRLYSVERVGIQQKRETGGPPKWRWFFNTGYRQDDLQWSIQGPTPPFLTLPPRYSNLLSELTWSDLQILQLEFGLQASPAANLIVRGQLGYGTIFDGSNQDSDYWGDNRTFEFSRSLQDGDSGETWDLSVGMGYDFLLFREKFKITPLVGLSYHGQNLVMQNGVQVLSDYGWPTSLGPFDGLDSSYDAKWYGPWIGLELGFMGVDRFSAGGPEVVMGLEYHYVDFDADAFWNLRGLNFEQSADGDGLVFYTGIKWFFTARWAMNFDFKLQQWETDPGTDRFWFGSGPIFETVFNGAEWDSISATIGITCRW